MNEFIKFLKENLKMDVLKEGIFSEEEGKYLYSRVVIRLKIGDEVILEKSFNLPG